MRLNEISMKARVGEQARVYLTRKPDEVVRAITTRQKDIPRRFKQTVQQAVLKAHDMSSQQRANLIEAIMQQVLGE